jgi:CRP-like cAMP-binding protein
MSTGESQQAAGYIREVPWLARLSEDDLQALARMGHYRTFERGEAIVTEGDTDSSLYVIIDGDVRVTVLSPAGDEALLARIGPGRPVGEFSLLDGQPRSATATAERRTRTFVVDRPAFLEWLEERPRAAAALLETLSLRIRKADQALSDMFFFELKERLARHLLQLADEIEQPGGNGQVRLRITQSEMAMALGVTREAVNKQLARFARAGYIQTGRGSVTIISIEGLRSIL